jgi:predicted TIM-barrel fold metal-dependent hydrolase
MIPPDAKTMGWSYSDGTYPSKEKLYERVERVLSRFPNLKVVFAHFYFLSANLKRASAIMDTYSNVNFDITPGSEMYYNFSREPEETRRFFINYQDRIVFGDDTAIRKKEDIPKERTITKIFVMRNFLETDERLDKSFSIIERKGEIQGIKLPVSVLNKIYQDNYLRIVGEDPCRLNITLAGKYCHRVGQILRIKFGFPNEMNFGYEAEDFLSSIKGRPK